MNGREVEGFGMEAARENNILILEDMATTRPVRSEGVRNEKHSVSFHLLDLPFRSFPHAIPISSTPLFFQGPESKADEHLESGYLFSSCANKIMFV